MARQVAIVPHTHWDREWYLPFQSFRMKLVDLLDDLLPRLDADPSYAHFMLDGQMAVIDDYLAVRPEAEATLRRLATAGRLSVGPWYILMDEFLVSGECMVRNLQLGLDRAAAFGGAMEVGYLPDMFGHVAQMPQLLRQFGFEHAVVWRGVPAAVDRRAFWWSAPDGSTVRAEYLVQGYGNGAHLPNDAKALVRRIDDFADDWDAFLDGGPILWMNGTDHLMPQPWLGRVVAEANDLQDDYELAVSSLRSVVESGPTEGLPSWTGELRSGARANLLMGVTSNRVDVRQAAAFAERVLEQLAEPLVALFAPPAAHPGPDALLDEAWVQMIRNSAHDSICACSVDVVCDAVLHRYAEAAQIADGVAERAVAALGRSVTGRGTVIVNPSPRPRGGIIEVIVPGDEPHAGTQLLEARAREQVMAEMDLAGSAAVLVRELKYNASLRTIQLESVRTGEVLWRTERDESGELVGRGVRRELDEFVAAQPPGRVRIRITREPTQRLLVPIAPVAGYGWRTWDPVGIDAPGATAPVVVDDGHHSVSNGLVRLDVDPESGTWAINGLAGFGRLVDGGDVGDTYNWCPPDADTIVDSPTAVTIDVVEAGPLRARLVVHSHYRWPARAEGMAKRSAETVDVKVATTLELRAGEEFVRVAVTFNNQARDHRLRMLLPLPEPATESEAECAFAIVSRGLTAEGGPTEAALPTFPAHRFVRAGGLTVAHDGVVEYELIDIEDGAANTLALTVVRCTGLLSQIPMATRPLPAGPTTAMEGPQLQGRVEARYAVSVDPDVDPYALVDDAFLPLRLTKAGGGSAPANGVGLELTLGAAQVSALRRVAGQLELRVFNPTAAPTTVTLPGRTGWLVDLRGRPVEPFEGSFDLPPFAIATAHLPNSG